MWSLPAPAATRVVPWLGEMKASPAPPVRTSRWRVLLLLGSQSPQRTSLPAPPSIVSEPWWPSSSSLSGPPAIVRPLLSSTFAKTPVIRGQPVCGTFAPPPTVWRPPPGPHWTLGSICAQGPPGSDCVRGDAVAETAPMAAAEPRMSRSGRSRRTGCMRARVAPARTDPCELCLVPEPEDADLALEAEHGQAAGREVQPPAEGHRLVDPARRERPQDVAVGEDRDVAVDRQDLVDHPVAPRGDLVGGLAVRHAVAPQVPL